MVHKFYEYFARFYFIAAIGAMMSVALVLFFTAIYEILINLPSENRISTTLEGIGLLIIGFAVIETGKFVAEEEILRRRELRSPTESRRSLTKFVTILVIAVSLEALVMIFKSGRENIPYVLYPTLLFGSSMFALVALGSYQWLSSRILQLPGEQEVDTELRKEQAQIDKERVEKNTSD